MVTFGLGLAIVFGAVALWGVLVSIGDALDLGGWAILFALIIAIAAGNWAWNSFAPQARGYDSQSLKVYER